MTDQKQPSEEAERFVALMTALYGSDYKAKLAEMRKPGTGSLRRLLRSLRAAETR